MDIDFYIITLSYLALIIFLHFNVRKNNNYEIPNQYDYSNNSDENEYENKENENENEVKNNLENMTDSSKYINELEKSVKNDYEMILNENEINNMKNNMAKNDFMKYLKIEEKDRNDTFKEIITPIPQKKQNKEKSDLDKFFSTHDSEKYNFEPVPNTDIDFQKRDLMGDVKKLNDERSVFNVAAFDDFDTPYSTI